MDRVIDPAIEALRESKDTDCISKQRLLEIKNKAIEDAYSVEDEDGGVVFCIRGADDLKEYLDNLFSSQELDGDIQGDVKSATTTDCISRKTAIEAIEKAYCNPCKERGDDYNGVRCRVCNFDDAIGQIDALPPVEPKLVCEDAISRQDLSDKVERYYAERGDFGSLECSWILDAIKNAPPVELERPKGEWKYSYKEDTGECSNCGYEHYLGTYRQFADDFCPSCGADMRGDKE